MRMLFFVAIGIALMAVGMLYFGQANLIYFPQRYASNSKNLEKVETVHYVSGGRKQWAYVPKRERDSPPDRIWWFFGGNGSVAWNWIDLVGSVDPQINQDFILFDYPGYGFNQGKPSPKSIARSIDDSLPVLAEYLGLEVEELLGRSRSVGHSLGAAIAFDLGSRHGVDTVVAISPFTKMEDMAKRQMGPVLGMLLSHRYDNESSIDAMLLRDEVSITIFHGDQDRLIPHQMGKDLSRRDTEGEGTVRFVSVSGAGHNDIVGEIENQLIEILETE